MIWSLFGLHVVVLQEHFVSIIVQTAALGQKAIFDDFEFLYLISFGFDSEENFLVFLFDLVEVGDEFCVFFDAFEYFLIFPGDVFLVAFVDLVEGFLEVYDLFGELLDAFGLGELFYFLIFVDVALSGDIAT